jgi:hypothetical protein
MIFISFVRATLITRLYVNEQSLLTFKSLDSYLFHPYIIDFNHIITFVYDKPVIVILSWDNVVAATY